MANNPLVLIVGVMSKMNSEDSMFAFDVARWVRVTEARGVPRQNIQIYGQLYWKAASGIADQILESEPSLGINKADLRAAEELYKPGKVVGLLGAIQLGGFTSVTLILLNHGSQDGPFGQCINKDDLARVVSGFNLPTVVVASQCFAAILFRSLVQLPNNNILRIHDDGNAEKIAYAWGCGNIEESGYSLGGTLLSYILIKDVLTRHATGPMLKQTFMQLHKDPREVDGCIVKVIVEGDVSMLERIPFFGGGVSPSLAFPQHVVAKCGLPSQQDTRPGVNPLLSSLIDSLNPPAEFWDLVYNPKCYDDVIKMGEPGLDRIDSLCAILRNSKLLDPQHPAALLCYAAVVSNVDSDIIAKVHQLQI